MLLSLDSENIKGILHQISVIKPALEWNLQCIYSDGQCNTMNKISFWLNDHKKRCVGTIVYQVESGKVLNFHYAGFLKSKNRLQEDIVDILLEILNYEHGENH